MMMWVGMKTESVYSLMFGRLVYGLGGESVYIALGAVLAAWFRGKEISFANVHLTIE
jgi:MFS family permease